MPVLNWKKITTILIFTIFIIIGFPNAASAVSGADFRAGRIIDDSQFFDGNAMTVNEIQAFLNSKVPVCDTNGTQIYSGGTTRASYGASRGYSAPYTCLKDYRQDTPSRNAETNLCGSYSGANRSAAEIIYEVGRSCGVSQKALIVLLQKEQSLVTDEWPWSIQYRSATGYGCPDTAPCDSEYYGFFNQVFMAARQFKRYARDASLYNHRVGRSSYVQYNPNANCGGANVIMENQATAGLYNYTPYQPNQAALNNLYGMGDNCSAYGNRNFWRLFNDWFGSTSADGYMRVISDDGSPTQYVVYGTIKQAIPSPDALTAWGLQNSPLITFPAEYLSSITNGPALDRFFIVNGGSDVFFVDAGKRYWVPNMNMFELWGFGGRTISSVSRDLGNLPTYSGELTYAFKSTSDSEVYMVGGKNSSNVPIVHLYANDNVLVAWENSTTSVTTLSDSFFDTMDNAIGTPINSTRISHDGNEYQVVGGRRYPLAAPYTSLYPSTSVAVSSKVFSRLPQSPSIQHLVRSATNPAIYLIDGGTKHHLLWPDIQTSWTADGTSVTIVNDGFLNLIPTGTSIGTYLADASGQLYILNKKKINIPESLDTAYRNAGSVYSSSSALMGVYADSDTIPTGFVRGASEPQVYLLDNEGKKRHLQWADKVTLWGGYKAGITVLPNYIIDTFVAAASPNVFVNDGTNSYVMEDGKKWTVSSDVQSHWGLNSPQLYTDGTLDRFVTAGALTKDVRDGSGGYYIVRGGVSYVTGDSSIAQMWGIDSAPMHDSALMRTFGRSYMLTRSIRSSVAGDNRLFIVNSGQWFNLSAAQAANLGISAANSVALNPSFAPNSITDWTSWLVKINNGDHFVIDGGTRRFLPAGTIRNQWTHSGSLQVPLVSDGFISLLPYRGIIERSFQGSGPSVYFMENNTKRHILYPNLLVNYVPFARVTDNLLNVLPNGSSISN